MKLQAAYWKSMRVVGMCQMIALIPNNFFSGRARKILGYFGKQKPSLSRKKTLLISKACIFVHCHTWHIRSHLTPLKLNYNAVRRAWSNSIDIDQGPSDTSSSQSFAFTLQYRKLLSFVMIVKMTPKVGVVKIHSDADCGTRGPHSSFIFDVVFLF